MQGKLMLSSQANVTQMLAALSEGKREMADKIFPLVYEELRRIAAGYMRRERRNHTLQTIDLVNEAYLKLVSQDNLSLKNRAHFFAIASLAMRQYLVDYARQHGRKKRGGGQKKISLEDTVLISEERLDEILEVDEALTRLAAIDERQSQIVQMRYFSGLTVEEIAEALDLSPITIKRDWRMAKAWLYHELKAE
jgi:RNA polymerase sigma factor (TIGR02999 family)